MPQLSLIIPVYNAEKYLKRCLDSVRMQSFIDFECICINDGSGDDSGSILDNYRAIDERIIVVHKENGGVSSARNSGIDLVRGEWIGFLDSDDWVDPDMYARLIRRAQETNTQLVECYCKIAENDGHVITSQSHFYKKDCVLQSSEWQQTVLDNFAKVSLPRTVLYHAKEIKDAKLRFNTGYSLYEDVDFVLSYSDLIDKVAIVNEELYYYRIQENSLVRTKGFTRQIFGSPHFFVMLQNKYGKDYSNQILLAYLCLFRLVTSCSKKKLDGKIGDFEVYISELYGYTNYRLLKADPKRYIRQRIKKHIQILNTQSIDKCILAYCLLVIYLPAFITSWMIIFRDLLNGMRVRK